jgi:tetratricopeptide (TPR) repeat protein
MRQLPIGETDMRNKDIWKSVALPVLLVFILTGCATTVELKVQRPPTLNTSGIKRIAIMPFESASSGSAYSELAQYATSVTVNRIKETNYFTLVDSSEIERLRRNNQSIENYVDALLVGRVTRVSVQDGTGQYQTTNRQTGVTTTTTYYTREAEIEFSYSLVRARDGSVLGPVSRKGNTSQQGPERSALGSATALLRPVIDNQLRLISQDLIPHTVIENRTLANDNSNNKALQAEMKNALARIKEGSYKTALENYLEIFQRYGSFAAAENASILYEALGDTQAAVSLMRQALNETGNPRAQDALARLNKNLQDQAAIAGEYGDSRGQLERVSAFASDEIQKVLPKNARVWIYNNSPAVSMAEAVVDNITASLIQKGIGLVDRQNTALIEAEQQFQMSGYVSDNDFVSIGNMAGANIIVTIGITGTGAMRRLQVRVLDIERGVPLMQSDTGERWQI